MKTTEQQMTDLISRLREIEELLACSAGMMTPAIHGKAAALVSWARFDAMSVQNWMGHDIRQLQRELEETKSELADAKGDMRHYLRVAYGVTE